MTGYFQRKVLAMIVKRLERVHPELPFTVVESDYRSDDSMIRVLIGGSSGSDAFYLDLIDRGDGSWFAAPVAVEGGAVVPPDRRQPYSLGNRRGAAPATIADRFSEEIVAVRAIARDSGLA